MKKIIATHKKRVKCLGLMSGILLAAMSFVQSGYAQALPVDKAKICGRYTLDNGALKAAKTFESSPEHQKGFTNTPYSVRVYFHIFRDDNGTNAGATEAQIQTEFNQLVADYAGGNICFINMGLNYFNNTQINTNLNPDIPSNVLWLNPFLIQGCINIFYHAQIINYGGNAYAIPNTFCSIARGNIAQGHTISHEVGHCFGLLHTFDGYFGYENINGNNSSNVADLISDTPADPYAYKGFPCFSTSSCCYTGNCTDPNGQANFNVPYTNMMAYWWIFGYNNPTITPGQFARINSYLNTNINLMNCESASLLSIGPVSYTSGYHMLSAVNTLTTNGLVNFSGSAIATLKAKLILLGPGFIANASDGASILIQPFACGTLTNKSATQPRLEIAEKNNTISSSTSGVSVSPNPFHSTFELSIYSKQDIKGRVYVFNSLGEKVKEVPAIRLVKGSNKISLEGAALRNGIYIVEIFIGDERTVKKIVKL